jgi:hypothetical protein
LAGDALTAFVEQSLASCGGTKAIETVVSEATHADLGKSREGAGRAREGRPSSRKELQLVPTRVAAGLSKAGAPTKPASFFRKAHWFAVRGFVAVFVMRARPFGFRRPDERAPAGDRIVERAARERALELGEATPSRGLVELGAAALDTLDAGSKVLFQDRFTTSAVERQAPPTAAAFERSAERACADFREVLAGYGRNVAEVDGRFTPRLAATSRERAAEGEKKRRSSAPDSPHLDGHIASMTQTRNRVERRRV